MTFDQLENWHKRLSAIEKLKAIYTKDVKFNYLVNLLVDSSLSKKQIRQVADLAAFFKEYEAVEKPRVYLRTTNRRYLDVK